MHCDLWKRNKFDVMQTLSCVNEASETGTDISSAQCKVCARNNFGELFF